MKRIESLLVKKEETLFNVFKLRSMARPDDTMAVLMYGSPDPDAVASAMALREIMRQTVGLKNFALVATEAVLRQQNREFIRAMKVEIQLLHKVNLQEYRLVALVDAQPTFFGKAHNLVHPQIVIDHHPVTSAWHAELADVRPQYGALSTIMMEYLLAAKVRIPKILYTALLYGIKSDTNNFERDSILEDIGAYYLTSIRANRQLIRRIELNQIPERYLRFFEHAYSHRRRYRDRITSFLGKVDSPDVCVQVADFYLRIVDIYYVVIAGIIKDRLIIVFRGDGYRQDCGNIAAMAFGKYGSAGGHKSAARVEIPMDTLKEVLPGEWTQESIEQFLVQRLRQKRQLKTRKKTATKEKEST
ncbi:MAG TPA: DHH family phosphoesterase [Syntrophales bacterium]|jgi:nanoRNase/pAp phosphatase (c-di-AMP/oligoRNAs hydrolase)|nr:DHH family phosphoesterase [Syntrophales bacterium]HON23022.1 DHH family phosphoesterase [Syntrophales bacterium]HOU78823.1 DHH family phosphoesterase [Syntrophales bacterium]HQG35513.1 DHH family phosphoesterase [Syntrophales bacterium]HQI36890.1 DHH family phosphoesterase [Syntrophales bacterium]